MTYKELFEGCDLAMKNPFLSVSHRGKPYRSNITQSFFQFLAYKLGLRRYVKPPQVFTQEELNIAYRSGYLDCYTTIKNHAVDKKWKHHASKTS